MKKKIALQFYSKYEKIILKVSPENLKLLEKLL